MILLEKKSLSSLLSGNFVAVFLLVFMGGNFFVSALFRILNRTLLTGDLLHYRYVFAALAWGYFCFSLYFLFKNRVLLREDHRKSVSIFCVAMFLSSIVTIVFVGMVSPFSLLFLGMVR